MVEQEIGPVLFFADRKLGRNWTMLDSRDLELDIRRVRGRPPPRCPVISTDVSWVNETAVSHSASSDLGPKDHALQIAETVAQDDEAQLAFLAPVIDPTFQGDLLVGVVRKFGDGDDGAGHALLLSSAGLYTTGRGASARMTELRN